MVREKTAEARKKSEVWKTINKTRRKKKKAMQR